MRALLALMGTLGALACLMLMPVGGAEVTTVLSSKQTESTVVQEGTPGGRPGQRRRLLFIHHSVGGQLLAAPGPELALGDSLYRSHPNGGDLRRRLEAAGYEVHEATYGSRIGEKTDLFDWPPKFSGEMARLLTTSFQDQRYQDGESNQVVLFKSCFPNSELVGVGTPPGDPRGPALTLWNARAAFMALREALRRHPEVLFVYLTAPPMAPRLPRERLGSVLWRRWRGAPDPAAARREGAALARQLNDWLKAPSGWLAGYPHHNIAVFDYFDVLTEYGRSDLSRYATQGGLDAHPSRAGNERAAQALVAFVQRAAEPTGLRP